MSKPIHTPSPAQLPTGFESVSGDEHDGMPLFVNGDPFDTVAMVLPRKECNANGRLLAAAYNAFDSAARKLNCNAVELAEAMQDGAIADMVEALKWYANNLTDHMDAKALHALAKVRGGAA